MQIVVLDGYTLNPGDNPWTDVEALGELTVYDRTDASDVVARARDADIILTNKTPVSAEAIAEMPNLKLISVLATGFNIVDIEAARARQIPVCNVPVYGTDTVAQHIFSSLLYLIHRPIEHDAAIRDGKWRECGDFCFWISPLRELAGQTMGIIGFGRIGRRVGELANAFGMRVLAHDVFQENPPGYEGFEFTSVDELVSRSDVISLHCPQTADNSEFVNAALIDKMKPTAILMNAARGGLINERDLADALNNDRLAAACLDVVSVEPILEDNPMLGAKNCLLTPHIAWATVEARTRLMKTTAENIAAFQQGSPQNVVNP